MIVVIVFLSILNQREYHLVVNQNRKEDCHHDHIPFNVKGNGILVFSVCILYSLETSSGDHVVAPNANCQPAQIKQRGNRGKFNQMFEFNKRLKFNKMLKFNQMVKFNHMLKFNQMLKFNHMLKFDQLLKFNQIVKFNRPCYKEGYAELPPPFRSGQPSLHKRYRWC